MKHEIPSEEALVCKHMGLVRMAVARCHDTDHDKEELMQVGAIGLLKALRRFDPTQGVQFSTYAVPVIFGEIRRFLRDDSMIRISRTLKERHKKIRQAENFLQTELGRSPTLRELTQATHLSEEDILEAMDAPIQTASLDEPVGEEDGAVLGELIPYPDTETSDDRILLQENLQMLTAEERKLITLRYFMGKTQQETGQYLHTSQVQVSRKEKKILEKLKKQMTP